MQFILETINIISSYQVQRINTLDNPYGSDTKFARFYKGVKEGQIKNDQDAIRLLYDGEEANTSYSKLKNRLKHRLINSLFFIDPNKTAPADLQNIYHSCYKEWAAVQILFGRSAQKSAVRLAEKLLKVAIRFEFTEIIFNISRALRLHYAKTAGGQKKYRQYQDLFTTYKAYLEAECHAEELYQKLLIDLRNTAAPKAKQLRKAQAAAKKLASYTDKVSTFNFVFFSQSIFVMPYEMVHDHPKVIAQCQQALAILNSKAFALKDQRFYFLYKIYCGHIQLGQYEQAADCAANCLNTIEEGSANWFRFYLVAFRYDLFTMQYSAAARLVHQIMHHPRFVFQSPDIQESWRILRAYTYFLALIGKVEESDCSKTLLRKFRLSKFLNEVPLLSKDKRGHNIAILIIQILILLAQGKCDPIIDLTHSLERYYSRYLRQDSTFRSNCFVKMLAQLPKGYFNRIAVERRTQSLLSKLRACPLHSVHQSIEMEIVPYERLWEMVMEVMEHNSLSL